MFRGLRWCLESGQSVVTAISCAKIDNLLGYNRSVHLGEQSWKAAKELQHRAVVLPIGACEQHGHHLPLLTDAIIGQEIARRSELELGDEALFLPMLWVGSSHHHLSFPGTVSISARTYTNVLIDMLESLIEGGFRRMVFLNSHSGNSTPARMAINEVQIKYRRQMPDLWLAFVNWFELVSAPDDWRQKKIIHACEWETSTIQAVRPDLVNEADMPATLRDIGSKFYKPDYSAPGKADIARTIEQNSPSGAFGYPEAAAPEKGEILYEQAAREFAAFVREFSQYQS